MASTAAILKEMLPNFPDALAQEWLAPYVDELGPPKSFGRWLNILAGKPLEFWSEVSWFLMRINLVQCTLNSAI